MALRQVILLLLAEPYPLVELLLQRFLMQNSKLPMLVLTHSPLHLLSRQMPAIQVMGVRAFLLLSKSPQVTRYLLLVMAGVLVYGEELLLV